MEPQDVAAQVMENCNIANAKNWGSYSVCGLLLRLRELYRWEKNLEPWEPIDHAALLEWIDAHEKSWEKLSAKEFNSLNIDGRVYHPFNVTKINAAIREIGHAYGAGYARGLRPSFFLAEIEDSYSVEGYPVLVLSRELARDLVSYPVMLLGDVIYARKQPLRYYLWEKIFEARGQKGGLLWMAFEDYGYDFSRSPASQKALIEEVLERELEVYLRHEIGEARSKVFPEEVWREIVGNHPGTRIEYFARGVRDVLADTCEGGMLEYIIKTKNLGSLGLFTALLSGYRKLILPDFTRPYLTVRKDGDWALVEKARRRGFEIAVEHAQSLVKLYMEEKDGDKFEENANKLLSRFRL